MALWNRRKNGEIFPEWLTINTIRDEDGQVQRYVALGSDITNKVRSDELDRILALINNISNTNLR